MRKLTILCILLLLVIAPGLRNAGHVEAQANACDVTSVIAAANALKSTGDAKKDIQALLKLDLNIHSANLACNGLTFKGDGNKVIGPFIIPKGTYKVTVITRNAFTAEATSLAGSDCNGGTRLSLLSEINMEGTRDITSQTLLPVSADCKIVLKTSNSSNPWTLTFEPIN